MFLCVLVNTDSVHQLTDDCSLSIPSPSIPDKIRVPH